MQRNRRYGSMVALTLTLLLVAGCSNPFGSRRGGSNGGSGEALFPQHVEFRVFATAGLPHVTLFWARPDSSVTSYQVFRSASSGDYDFDDPVAELSSVAPDNSYVDATVTTGTPYFYVIRALANGSVVGTAAEISATARTGTLDLEFVYVDPSAADGGDGSYAAPFNTIGAGVASVNPNGTVLLMDGSYQLTASVALTKPLIIRSVSGSYRFSEAIINAGAIGNTAAVEFLGGSDGSVLQGLRFTAAVRTSSSQGMIRIGSGSGNDPDDVQILHNHLYQNQGIAISNHMGSGQSIGTVIAGNWITDHGGGHAVRIDRGLVDGRFENNIIENVADSGAGINMDRSTGFVIARNRFTNISGHGLNLGGATSNFTVSDNLLEHANAGQRSDGGGIRLYGASHTDPVLITGNTVKNSFNSIYQRDDDISVSDITITGNSIISPISGSMLIVNAATTGTLDARGNWFGSAEEDDFKDFIDGDVDYSDWLTAAP
ncbi:MAG: hypothetical protein EA384_15425 [Spirochaetaceae bacterium]|nr:MAG: hypothetical protein EA384_15425 [Spirochaetaceae bacterium]